MHTRADNNDNDEPTPMEHINKNEAQLTREKKTKQHAKYIQILLLDFVHIGIFNIQLGKRAREEKKKKKKWIKINANTFDWLLITI